jgi:hypothetical protein
MNQLSNEVQAICRGLIAGARYGIKIRLPHSAVMTLLFRRELSAANKLQAIASSVAEHATNLAAFACLYKSILAVLKWASQRRLDDFLGDFGRMLVSMLGTCCLRIAAHRSMLLSSPDSLGTVPFTLCNRYGFGRATLPLVSVPNDEAKLNSVLVNSTEPGRPERPYHALVAGAVGGYFVWGRYSSVNYQIVLYLTSRVLVGLWKRHWLRNHKSTDLLPEALTKRSFAIGAATVWGLVMFLFESHPDVLHPSLKNSMDEIYR